jgi:hypothetical protein
MTRSRVPQIVVFGEHQKLSTPISLTAGRHIMITARAGSDTVTVSRLSANDDADQKITTSTRVTDIIRAVGKLNAAYPDVAQMLVQAEKQSNLPGRLEIDALPQAGRAYYRTVASEGGASPAREKIQVGNPSAVPNMFPAPIEVSRPRPARPFHSDADDAPDTGDDRGRASLVDARDGDDEAPKPRRSGGFLGWFRSRNDATE